MFHPQIITPYSAGIVHPLWFECFELRDIPKPRCDANKIYPEIEIHSVSELNRIYVRRLKGREWGPGRSPVAKLERRQETSSGGPGPMSFYLFAMVQVKVYGTLWQILYLENCANASKYMNAFSSKPTQICPKEKLDSSNDAGKRYLASLEHLMRPNMMISIHREVYGTFRIPKSSRFVKKNNIYESTKVIVISISFC